MSRSAMTTTLRSTEYGLCIRVAWTTLKVDEMGKRIPFSLPLVPLEDGRFIDDQFPPMHGPFQYDESVRHRQRRVDSQPAHLGPERRDREVVFYFLIVHLFCFPHGFEEGWERVDMAV
jgi:hypothetical protein